MADYPTDFIAPSLAYRDWGYLPPEMYTRQCSTCKHWFMATTPERVTDMLREHFGRQPGRVMPRHMFWLMEARRRATDARHDLIAGQLLRHPDNERLRREGETVTYEVTEWIERAIDPLPRGCEP